VVVPTCRPAQLESFLEAWQPLFEKHDVLPLIVHDNEEGWATIPEWIPRGTDMIRSWGIYQAWREGREFTLTLDDDVRPLYVPAKSASAHSEREVIDIFAEYEAAFSRPSFCSEYFSVGDLTTDGSAMRGFPYRDRASAMPAIQYGGWYGVLDFDAATQLVGMPHDDHEFAPVCIPVPKGAAVTTCIMNAAWRTELAPIMWQLPMVDGKYNRFGDIWSGLLQKKILDHFGLVMLINGAASIYHSRASDPITNLEREAPGIRINETLWEHLGAWAFGDTMEDAYRSIVHRFAQHPQLDPEYAEHLEEVSDRWLELFGW
jgi:hypothetical protein